MKRITFSVDDRLIERARLRAANEKKTLNSAFREWLTHYAGEPAGRAGYESLMKQLAHVKTTRSFSGDERNQR